MGHGSQLPTFEAGMNTILIVGNASTRLLGGKMVTPRGYEHKEHKYDLHKYDLTQELA